jgi:hypothetical protein
MSDDTKKIEDGGPAFAAVAYEGIGGAWTEQIGMSLRDYFAAKAMQGLIADPDRADQSREECARLSYLMADAMLKAREAP